MGQVGSILPSALTRMVDTPATLWNLSDRTRAGCFNCISEIDGSAWNQSLYLVAVLDLTVVLIDERNAPRAHYGSFHYNHVHYVLRITDPVLFAEYVTFVAGEYLVGTAWLAISLSHAYEKDHRCHKLIAGVMYPEGLR